MDQVEVLSVFDAQMRRGAGKVTAEGVVRVVDEGADGWAGVVWSDLDADSADRAIAAQTRWLESPEGRGREFEWKLYSHDAPADLAERLKAAGFAPEPPETLMIAEVAELPTDTLPPAGVRFEPVTDAAGVDLMAEVHEQAFGTSAARLRARLLDQLGSVEMTLAMAGDRPVCGARMEFHPGTDFASLWGGGTVARVARQGRLPLAGRPPDPDRRGPRPALPPGGRLGREPPDPGTARLHRARRHHAVPQAGLTRRAAPTRRSRRHEGAQRQHRPPATQSVEAAAVHRDRQAAGPGAGGGDRAGSQGHGRGGPGRRPRVRREAPRRRRPGRVRLRPRGPGPLGARPGPYARQRLLRREPHHRRDRRQRRADRRALADRVGGAGGVVPAHPVRDVRRVAGGGRVDAAVHGGRGAGSVSAGGRGRGDHGG